MTSSPRLLHAMLRVFDLERSLAFYRDGLGMRVLRQLHFQKARFSLVYLGYDDDRQATVLELTHNWDNTEPYTHGSGYGHLGIGVSDLAACCDRLAGLGFEILRHPGEMGTSGIHIAFTADPDRYRIELIALPYPLPAMGEYCKFD